MDNQLPQGMPPLPETSECPGKKNWTRALYMALGGVGAVVGGVILVVSTQAQHTMGQTMSSRLQLQQRQAQIQQAQQALHEEAQASEPCQKTK